MSKRSRAVEGVNRRYVWRLYPTPDQAAQLREQAQMCADLWNALLFMIEQRQSRAVQRQDRGRSYHCGACAALSELAGHRERLCPQHKLPSEFDIGNWISDPARRGSMPEGHLLRDCPEWAALSTWTPRRVAANLIAAFQAFFRRLRTGDNPGYPRYKSRLQHLSVPHRSVSGCRIWRGGPAWHTNRHRDNWSMAVKGVDGPIRARRQFAGAITEWMDVDIIYRDGHWEASAAVSTTPWRRGGQEAVTIQFDLIDGLALVNGRRETPDEMYDVQLLVERYDEMQADHDQHWPRGCLLTEQQQEQRRASRDKLAQLAAKIARKRKNALHCWTASIVRRASALTVLTPAIKKTSESVRGQKRAIGAYAVDAAIEINRVALGYAPSMAVAMLDYKAREAGIPITVLDDPQSPYLERLAIIAAGRRERSNDAKNASAARSKKRRRINGVGLDESILPAAVGHAVGIARR